MSSPSIVPTETFYVVRDQYPDGDVFRETEVQRARFDEVLSDLASNRQREPFGAVYLRLRSLDCRRCAANDRNKRAPVSVCPRKFPRQPAEGVAP
jgi:hypothetical protein